MQGIQGLYVVTPDIADTMCLSKMVKSAILGGANVVQYRNKLADKALQLSQASALLNICRGHRIPLIINDDVMLVKMIDADGVHLGATDGDIAHAREVLGADKMIGASCYGDLMLANNAVQQGASYVAFGACFASSTKPNAPLASHTLFKEAQFLNVPVVAIGGITLQNATQLITAGVHAIAVINALFSAPDIEHTAQKFKQLFT
jgi:thiamine-phosphate pyrophosphorylase